MSLLYGYIYSSSGNRLYIKTTCVHTGNNLTGVAVQFATQDQQNATQVQKCIALFTIAYPITIIFETKFFKAAIF